MLLYQAFIYKKEPPRKTAKWPFFIKYSMRNPYSVNRMLALSIVPNWLNCEPL